MSLQTLLLNTKSNNIYTSRFIDWQPTIIEQYNYINEALNNVIGSSVIKRNIRYWFSKK